ncbi:MAG TPA: FAD-dependent oxidoreductase, partial [Longimicrobium sp.]|nr:FAD-dependent oxidoreductase [Longimicrobium sp.]
MTPTPVPAHIILPADPPREFRGEWTLDEVRRGSFSEHAGILRALPVAVAAPADAEDVAALARWASGHGIALVPRAAGTGMPGGNVGPGVAVDLKTRFGGIGPVDAERRTARVQPGATLGELNRAVAPAGLQFPVDPSSADRASMGGIIA